MFRLTDRQSTFKQLHGNIINNCISMKTIPFQQQQQQQNYGKISTHSKEMAKQRFKKDFDVDL